MTYNVFGGTLNPTLLLCQLLITVGNELDAVLWLFHDSVQEYFVKRANRGLLPSTHLVVNAAEGSKYKAARKWNLPAISKL